MKLVELTMFLERIAPLHLQEAYDNAGLITGNPDQEITGVICALDATEAIVDEAIERKCNVIVAHHPIVFSGLKRFTGSDYVQRTIIKAIKADVAIYAIHTNLDNVMGNGVNQRIAQRLGLENCAILAPKSPETPEIGSGLIGDLPETFSLSDFLAHVKRTMGLTSFKYTHGVDRPLAKIALCGGAGRFLLDHAIAAGADAFITSDIKYHEFFDAENHLVLLDIGHYESERYTIELLQELISEKFSTFAAHSTGVNTNPVLYYL